MPPNPSDATSTPTQLWRRLGTMTGQTRHIRCYVVFGARRIPGPFEGRIIFCHPPHRGHSPSRESPRPERANASNSVARLPLR